MNVFLYSEDQLLLSAVGKALQEEKATPFLVPDFNTLMSLVSKTDPDIAFLDENIFPKERIKHIQNHIFDILLDFPVTSMTDPYFTDYRGHMKSAEFNRIADIVMKTSREFYQNYNDYKIVLSPKLKSLLNFLISHKDEKVTTEVMIHHLWRENNAGHKKTLHTYICKLRDKLVEAGNKFVLTKVSKSTYSLVSN